MTLKLGSDGNLHIYTTGTTTDAVAPCPPASLTNITIASPSSNATNLTIDTTNGDPIPAGGLTYSGAGGLIKTGSGSMTLSHTNTYTGGTTVSAGTLIVSSASVIAANTSLIVGAGGIFIYDPTAAAATASAGTTADTPAVTSSPSIAADAPPILLTPASAAAALPADLAPSTAASATTAAPAVIDAANSVVVPSSVISAAAAGTGAPPALEPAAIAEDMIRPDQGGSVGDLPGNVPQWINGRGSTATSATDAATAAPSPSLAPRQMPADAGQSDSANGAAKAPIGQTASAPAQAADIVLSGLRSDSAGSAAASWLWAILDAQNQANQSSQRNDNAVTVDKLLAMTAP